MMRRTLQERPVAPSLTVAAKTKTATKKLPRAAGADSAAFRRFMLTRWKAPSGALPPQVLGLSFIRARRAQLSKTFAGELLLIPTGHEKVRANDTFYPFRAGSDFYYLTGNLEPDCVLALVPRARKTGHDAWLFVEPNPGKTDATFFTDRDKGELWVGPRLGVRQSKHRFGVTRAVGLGQLNKCLAAWQIAHGSNMRVLRGFDAPLEQQLRKPTAAQRRKDRELAATLSDMRLYKDAHEVRALRRACVSTRRGFEDVIERLAVGRSEREVEGVFNLRARMEGNAVGYGTIAAAGAHACTLHWTHNDGKLQRDELLLLDAGVEGHELYTADITRTLPIGGRFGKAQREIYDLVARAQAAAFAEVRPGKDFQAPNVAAMRVLAHGLQRLGILKDAEQDLHPSRQFYRRYTLHHVSHMLGIDVHDCAQARAQNYRYGALKAGMVLTVEPGLYFQPDDLSVPARYRGIGVRIEDDVLVTPRGMVILSDLPRDADAVQAWMAAVWKRARGRKNGRKNP